MFSIEAPSIVPQNPGSQRPTDLPPSLNAAQGGFLGELLTAETMMRPGEGEDVPLTTVKTQQPAVSLVVAVPTPSPETSQFPGSDQIPPIVRGQQGPANAEAHDFALRHADAFIVQVDAPSQIGKSAATDATDVSPVAETILTPSDSTLTANVSPNVPIVTEVPLIPPPFVPIISVEIARPVHAMQLVPEQGIVSQSVVQTAPRLDLPVMREDNFKPAPVPADASVPISTNAASLIAELKPTARHTQRPDWQEGERRSVENLAPIAAPARQSIDDAVNRESAGGRFEPSTSPSPTHGVAKPEAEALSDFQLFADKTSIDPNQGTIGSAMLPSSAKAAPETGLQRATHPYPVATGVEPMLEERVRVVQSDNSTVRLLAEADILGKIAISVSMFENGTEVAFKTESAETARQLQGAGSQIATRLEEVGGRQSRVTVEMSHHGGLTGGFAQDGSRQSRSSENWPGSSASRVAVGGPENGDSASYVPPKAVRLA